jgi:hypothetical protein
MTEYVDRSKDKEVKYRGEKWYRSFWDYVIPDEPENDLEYSGIEKEGISENMKTYLKQRFKTTRKYCKKRVKQSMYNFYLFQLITIIVSALIPIINLIGVNDKVDNDIVIRVVSSLFGSLIVIVTGILQIFKLYEKWILFMSTVDSLEYEYYCYVYGLSQYSTSNDPDKLFVQKIESIILAKGERYLANIERTKNGGKDK